MQPDLVSYLSVLAGEAPSSAFLEIRYRVRRDVLAAEFFPAHDRDALVEAIGRRTASTDVYVGCAPRLRRSGTRNDVGQVWVLWAECDGADAAEAAMAYDPPPAMIVASGSGPNIHAYWPLSRPVSPRDAERANLRLAHAIGADRACYDAARILRPPGTWNQKHTPPTRVATVRMEVGVALEPAVVVERAPRIEGDPIERRWTVRGGRDVGGDPLLRLTPALYVSTLLGVDARSGRKVHCPFHTDERASLHVYPTAARGRCCFPCGRGGSIYDLAAALWVIDTRGRDFVKLRRGLFEHFERELARRSPSLER